MLPSEPSGPEEEEEVNVYEEFRARPYDLESGLRILAAYCKMRPYKPQPPSRGNDDPRTIYEAVGSALSEWENVEETLFGLFAFFVSGVQEADYISPAARAYGSIVGFTGRKDMLDAAAKAYFHQIKKEEMMAGYNAVLKTVSAYAPRRNEIAHGIVTMLAEDDWFLIPPSYMTKKTTLDEEPTYKYTRRQINRFQKDFGALVNAVHTLSYVARSIAPPRP